MTPVCHIARMLHMQKKRHISFHTPGHKRAGADITELSYSDNLLSPHGVIARAQEDAARILGASRSFFLTDGSTCGVHAMLYALKQAGVKRVAYGAYSHKSVKEGCSFLGLEGVELEADDFPFQPSREELARGVAQADALLLTSPDYYGFFPDLTYAKELCAQVGKPLVIDGAHGAHLHFSKRYAGNFACMWVDGAHKSLPALTQGAVVSAKDELWAERLNEAVDVFRTTSPSYPVVASVEYAVKYPENKRIEGVATELKRELGAYPNEDWSKILIGFGEHCDAVQRYLESRGVYPEFNDGNFLMFYLSPCTKVRHLNKLKRLLKRLPRGSVQTAEAERAACAEGGVELLPLEKSAGRVCARECGMFPPCLPLIRRGEVITERKIGRLMRASGVYGLWGGKIYVFSEET